MFFSIMTGSFAGQIVFQNKCKFTVHVPGLFGGSELQYIVEKGATFAENGNHEYCGPVTTPTPYGDAHVTRCVGANNQKVVSVSGGFTELDDFTGSDCQVADANTLPSPPSGAPVQAQDVIEPTPPRDQGAAGCLHQTVQTCIASAARYLKLMLDPQSDLQKRAQQIDVNGKNVAGDTFILSGTREGGSRVATITLTLTSANIVRDAVLTTDGDPTTARTADEYEQTWIYEAFNILLGDVCVHDRMTTYRFFENQLKPKLTKPTKNVDIGDISASSTYIRSANHLPFCNAAVSFSELIGIDTENISLNNPHGAFVTQEIAVK
jgi:hypothetical protein